MTDDDMKTIGLAYVMQRGFTWDDSVDKNLRNMLLAMETGNVDRMIADLDTVIDKAEAREKSAGKENVRKIMGDDFK